ARQVVAALRAAAEKEPAAQHIVRLVDRDVGSGHISVPDEKRGCRQSAEAATDDMSLHLPSFLDSGVGRSSRREPGKQRVVGLAKGNRFQAAFTSIYFASNLLLTVRPLCAALLCCVW